MYIILLAQLLVPLSDLSTGGPLYSAPGQEVSTSMPTASQLLLETEYDITDVWFTGTKVHKGKILWLNESNIQSIWLAKYTLGTGKYLCHIKSHTSLIRLRNKFRWICVKLRDVQAADQTKYSKANCLCESVLFSGLLILRPELNDSHVSVQMDIEDWSVLNQIGSSWNWILSRVYRHLLPGHIVIKFCGVVYIFYVEDKLAT